MTADSGSPVERVDDEELAYLYAIAVTRTEQRLAGALWQTNAALATKDAEIERLRAVAKWAQAYKEAVGDEYVTKVATGTPGERYDPIVAAEHAMFAALDALREPTS